MANRIQYVTVDVPHQPKKGFRREFEENPEAEEPNGDRIRRELKSLQIIDYQYIHSKMFKERLSNYYQLHREDRERHRLNLLNNLNQLDLYWFEWDFFDAKMFRFRCAWTNHLVDEIIEQLWSSTCGILKDLWSLECEVDKHTSKRLVSQKTMDVVKRSNFMEYSGNSTGEYIMQTMTGLKMELDKLETTVAKKREAHRRILLKDLLVIKQNLRIEKVNNGVNFLIEHFNDKVAHSLKAIMECHQMSMDDYMKLLKNVQYVCNELTDRLILDTSMPEFEKSILGKELNQFMRDAKSHIQEVDNFSYELRELARGTNLKKLRGLTKDEYKERIHDIIAFIEKAEVPLRVFKTVGFAMQKTEELSAENTTASENQEGYVSAGPLEDDYPDDS